MPLEARTGAEIAAVATLISLTPGTRRWTSPLNDTPDAVVRGLKESVEAPLPRVLR